MNYRLRIVIVGVPVHLCLRSKALEILKSSYSVITLALEMESKATLKEFFITAGCIHPDLLPVKKVTVAPVPTSSPDVQPCLQYRVVINILEVMDLSLTRDSSASVASDATPRHGPPADHTSGLALGGAGPPLPLGHHPLVARPRALRAALMLPPPDLTSMEGPTLGLCFPRAVDP